MLILVENYTRNLVFFGVIDALVAIWGLYGVTKMMDHQNQKSDRIKGLVILILAIVLLVIANVLAVIFTHK